MVERPEPRYRLEEKDLEIPSKTEHTEGTRATQLRVVDSRTFEHMEAPWKEYNEK